MMSQELVTYYCGLNFHAKNIIFETRPSNKHQYIIWVIYMVRAMNQHIDKQPGLMLHLSGMNIYVSDF